MSGFGRTSELRKRAWFGFTLYSRSAGEWSTGLWFGDASRVKMDCWARHRTDDRKDHLSLCLGVNCDLRPRYQIIKLPQNCCGVSTKLEKLVKPCRGSYLGILHRLYPQSGRGEHKPLLMGIKMHLCAVGHPNELVVPGNSCPNPLIVWPITIAGA